MRAALVLLIVAGLLQGCTALSAGVAADLDRQHRAEARVDVATQPPTRGDTLTVYTHSGETLTGAVVALDADTLRLDAGAVAVGDIARAERPWQRQNAGRATGRGFAIDVVLVLLLVSAALSGPWH